MIKLKCWVRVWIKKDLRKFADSANMHFKLTFEYTLNLVNVKKTIIKIQKLKATTNKCIYLAWEVFELNCYICSVKLMFKPTVINTFILSETYKIK